MTSLFKSALRPGMNVLDIGANIGYYSLIAAKAGCIVYAFEPDPRNLEYLRRNLIANRVAGSVTVVNKPVSDQVGSEVFYQHPSLLESSLYSDLAFGAATSMPTTTIDDYFPDNVVNVIKLDIEGAEIRALRGMERLLARCCGPLTMFVECYPEGLAAAGASGKTLVDWLKERGFQVEAIAEHSALLIPINKVDLREPTFGGESVRAFNLYCTRN